MVIVQRPKYLQIEYVVLEIFICMNLFICFYNRTGQSIDWNQL